MHDHVCLKCGKSYVCPHPFICGMDKEVNECGKCFNARMKDIAFRGVTEGSNGKAYVGPDGTPLKPINYSLPNPDDMPPFLRKSMIELVEAEKERLDAKAAKLAEKNK